jgi:hypothetical protein
MSFLLQLDLTLSNSLQITSRMKMEGTSLTLVDTMRECEGFHNPTVEIGLDEWFKFNVYASTLFT